MKKKEERKWEKSARDERGGEKTRKTDSSVVPRG